MKRAIALSVLAAFAVAAVAIDTINIALPGHSDPYEVRLQITPPISRDRPSIVSATYDASGLITVAIAPAADTSPTAIVIDCYPANGGPRVRTVQATVPGVPITNVTVLGSASGGALGVYACTGDPALVPFYVPPVPVVAPPGQ